MSSLELDTWFCGPTPPHLIIKLTAKQTDDSKNTPVRAGMPRWSRIKVLLILIILSPGAPPTPVSDITDVKRHTTEITVLLTTGHSVILIVSISTATTLH